MVDLDPLGRVTDKWLLAFHNQKIMVSCEPCRPKKIKTAIWIGEKQWQALKALADSLDREVLPKIRTTH